MSAVGGDRRRTWWRSVCASRGVSHRKSTRPRAGAFLALLPADRTLFVVHAAMPPSFVFVQTDAALARGAVFEVTYGQAIQSEYREGPRLFVWIA